MSEHKPEPHAARRPAHLRVVAAGERASAAHGQPARGAQGKGEPLDLDQAYRRYAPYVAAVAVRILGRDEELDDLVQDVFLDATRGLRGLRDPEAIRGWLAKIAVRTAVRRLRRRRLRKLLMLEREPIGYEAIASPDASPEQRALIARVYEALDRLPADERVAWTLRHAHGETLERAAELCECSLSTYQRRLRRADARLSRELEHG